MSDLLATLIDAIESGKVTIIINGQTETPPAAGPYSVSQAAKLLGVSKETVYREVEQGAMPHSRIKRRITITVEQLNQYRQQTATKLPLQPGKFRHIGRRAA